MADNTTLPVGSGGDVIATDELTTLNGGAVSGFKAQRVKAGFGADGVLRDVSAGFPFPVDLDSKRVVTFKGRGSTFRTPGRGGTVGHKIFSLFNAAASPVLVDVEKVSFDMETTVVKAVTVLPPVVRIYRITAAPTGGTAVSKITRDTNFASNASVTALGDSSADGTSSATALTSTLAVGNYFTQFFAPRLITAAGYQTIDRAEFMDGDDEKITLRAGQGIVVMLDYTLATQSATTDMYVVNCKWTEYTAA